MPGVSARPSDARGGGRLESWKEIAAYLKRDLRTVQRWEKSEGLPVHRHVHNKLSSVFAYTTELEAWRAARRAELLEAETSRESRRVQRWIWAAGLAAVLSVAVLTTWRFAARSTPPAAKVVPVTTYPGVERYPSFSPDGKQIAFTWNGEKQDQFDVYVKFLGPGDPLRLTNDPAEELFPTWSPDGRWIAFLRTLHGSTRAVCIVGALGGPERTIAEADGTSVRGVPSSQLTWTPDGKGLIVVDREATEEAPSLFLLSVGGGEKQRLTRAPSWFDSSPAVSPDGQALAFVRVEGAMHSVYLQPLSEDFTAWGEPQRITSEKWGVTNLSWTADAQALLCSNYKEPNRGLWKIPRTGGAAVPEPAHGGSFQDLAVSRQGDRIAYTQEDRDSDIWRLDLGSERKTRPMRVVSSTLGEMTPHLSPDGKSIAYVSTRSGHHEVWKSNPDGTNSEQLTRYEGPFLLGPRWSPDGNEIAFSAGGDIHVVGAGGGKPRLVTTGIASDILPDWSPDGRLIYFTSIHSSPQEVWKVPAAGGEPIRVSTLGGRVRSAYVSPDGRFVYCKVGNPIGSLWRVPVDGGEAVKVLDLVYLRNFQVMDDGIYFLSETKPAESYALKFLRFRDGGVERIAEIEQNVAAGFSISRDRKHFYYWAWEQRGGDIMMIENFRW